MKSFSISTVGKPEESGRTLRLIRRTIAVALLITFVAGGVWHVHNTPESAAACTACHIGHAPAITGDVVNSILPITVEFGFVSCADPIFRSAPVLSSKTSRAPPAVA